MLFFRPGARGNRNLDNDMMGMVGNQGKDQGLSQRENHGDSGRVPVMANDAPWGHRSAVLDGLEDLPDPQTHPVRRTRSGNESYF